MTDCQRCQHFNFFAHLALLLNSFCIKAKQALDAYGAKYTVVELDTCDGGYPLRAELAAREGRTSVPALYVGGAFVGGCNDGGLGGVLSLDKKGELKPMLVNAGCI